MHLQAPTILNFFKILAPFLHRMVFYCASEALLQLFVHHLVLSYPKLFTSAVLLSLLFALVDAFS